MLISVFLYFHKQHPVSHCIVLLRTQIHPYTGIHTEPHLLRLRERASSSEINFASSSSASLHSTLSWMTAASIFSFATFAKASPNLRVYACDCLSCLRFPVTAPLLPRTESVSFFLAVYVSPLWWNPLNSARQVPSQFQHQMPQGMLLPDMDNTSPQTSSWVGTSRATMRVDSRWWCARHVWKPPATTWPLAWPFCCHMRFCQQWSLHELHA